MTKDKQQNEPLPPIAQDYIASIIKKMRYRRRKIRNEVSQELTDHFTDALADCNTDDERNDLAKNLIKDFGDPKQLAKLICRGKKRCRPLWKKIMIRTSQVFGCLILFIILRGAYIGLGQPTVTVNYLQWLTDQSRQNRDESDNAFPYIVKAFEQFTKPANDDQAEILKKWPDEMTPEELAFAKDHLAKNQTALKLFRQATEKPYYGIDYTNGMEEWRKAHSQQNQLGNMSYAVEKIISDARLYRPISKTIGLASAMAAYQGNQRQALSDCVTLKKFAQFLSGHGLLIEQLIGHSIEMFGHKHILHLLSRGDFDTETLRWFHSQLSQTTTDSFPMSLEEEKIFLYDFLQHGFTDDGRGNGRVLAQGIPLVVNDWQDAVGGIFLMNFPDRREALAMIDAYFEQTKVWIHQTPYQRRNNPESSWPKVTLDKQSVFLSILLPAHSWGFQMAWKIIATRRAIQTILILKIYQKEKGAFPDTLEELMNARYLEKLPDDPYSAEPLVYQRRGEDFILYSLGADFEDNGGIENPDDSWGQREDGGDHIFWPVR